MLRTIISHHPSTDCDDLHILSNKNNQFNLNNNNFKSNNNSSNLSNKNLNNNSSDSGNNNKDLNGNNDNNQTWFSSEKCQALKEQRWNQQQPPT